MLARRLRRRPNIETALGQRLIFSGQTQLMDTVFYYQYWILYFNIILRRITRPLYIC